MENDKRGVPKQKIKDFGTIFFVMIFFPYIINLVFHGISPEKIVKERLNDTIVIVATDIGYEKIPLEDYLIGALAASIDSGYEEEALKAQAVLLRTSIIYERMKNTKEADNHNNEVFQENIKQSYWTVADMQERYGDHFKESYSKLKTLIEATDNIILTYQGAPIETPFFAISAGSTRSGEEAFGNDHYPYLKSVKCENDILSEHYLHKDSFTWKQLEELLISQDEKPVTGEPISGNQVSGNQVTGEAISGNQVSGEPISENQVSGEPISENQVSEESISGEAISGNQISANQVLKKTDEKHLIYIEKTDSAGYVLSVRVGEKLLSGEEFRKKLHLNSSHMTIEESERGVQIQTKGLGHGVGMSQYAANHLAKNGSDFIEILSYFFTDTEIDKN